VLADAIPYGDIPGIVNADEHGNAELSDHDFNPNGTKNSGGPPA
jgi:hypothetical protein